jgi:hypothetical protein
MTDEPLDPGAVTFEVREAVGVFHDAERLEDAIDALQRAGFDRAQLNLVASRAAAERKLGRPIDDLHELEDEPLIPFASGVDRHELAEGQAAVTAGLAGLGSLVAIGTMVATGGSLALVLGVGALAGGLGGGLGAPLARALGARHAATIRAQLDRGGLLLWAMLRDPVQERRAVAILEAHGAEDVHVHTIEHHWGADEVPIRRWQPDPLLFKV